jgi:hypothetical protein
LRGRRGVGLLRHGNSVDESVTGYTVNSVEIEDRMAGPPEGPAHERLARHDRTTSTRRSIHPRAGPSDRGRPRAAAAAHGDKWGAITVQLRRIYYGIAQRAEPGIRELYCEREMVAPGVGELRTIPELQPISSRAVLPDPRLWTGTGYDSDPRD